MHRVPNSTRFRAVTYQGVTVVISVGETEPHFNTDGKTKQRNAGDVDSGHQSGKKRGWGRPRAGAAFHHQWRGRGEVRCQILTRVCGCREAGGVAV